MKKQTEPTKKKLIDLQKELDNKIKEIEKPRILKFHQQN